MYGITPVTGHTLLWAAVAGSVADAPRFEEAVVPIYVLHPESVPNSKAGEGLAELPTFLND